MNPKITLSLLLFALAGTHTEAAPIGTAFTYSGRLDDEGSPANGLYDLRFGLYPTDAGGSGVGTLLTNANVGISNGLFFARLDFGAGIFDGTAYWVEISVRTNGSLADFTRLSPRQPLNPVPYALYATNAGAAATANSASTAASATSFSGSLAGDVIGTQSATAVVSVGGRSAASVASGVSAANAATSANTPNTILRRDAAGGFEGGNIAATNFIGNGAGLTNLNPASLASGTAGINISGTAATASGVTPGAITDAGIQNGSLTAGKFANGQVVRSLNGLTDSVGIVGGTNIVLWWEANVLRIEGTGIQDGSLTAVKLGPGQVVKTLNGLTDSISLSAGTNITLTTNGNSIAISSTGLSNYVAKTGDRMSGDLNVSAPAAVRFGFNTRQMLDLYDVNYGIGVQNNTLYQRTGGGFAWYYGGTHSDGQNDPGTNGTALMTLDSSGDLLATGTLTGNYGVYGTSSGGEFGSGVSGNDPSGKVTSSGVSGTSSAGTGINGTSSSGVGVSGTSVTGSGTSGISSSGDGVSGTSVTRSGIHGSSQAVGSTVAGVVGQNLSNGGNGVIGIGKGAGGTGVAGVDDADNSTGVYGRGGNTGVFGESTIPFGYGVYGKSVQSAGVYGRSSTDVGVSGNSDTGAGVYGGSGANIGVVGYSESGLGVYGSSGGHGAGVAGSSVYQDGVDGDSYAKFSSGVRGENHSAGVGVTGIAHSDGSGNGSGVHGIAIDGASNAGWFDGTVYITSTLVAVGGKFFKIDHPLDPANKYLLHSCVESPDVMNIYNGNATTDSNGEAAIMLPSYFEALNRDFRYQLTVIGQFAQAIVASEIKDNQFTIKTDKPDVKVCWQVTGIRQDAYMKAHPMVVEQDKPQSERGTYQHPELFGQPEEKGLAWAKNPELWKGLREQSAKQAASPKP